MELPSQEAEMPIPLNSTYGGGHAHMIHHHHHDHPPPPNNHIIPSSNPSSGPPITPSPPLDQVDHVIPFKKLVKYRECLKNHAASMGGNATDGCGEFMPSGEEGTLEALTCSACNCHRNFHRKEIEGGDHHHQPNNSVISPCDNCYNVGSRIGRKVFVGHHRGGFVGPDAIGYHHHPSRAHVAPPHQMIMSYNMGVGGGGGGNSLPSESDEMEGGGGGGVVIRPPQMVKKRFRTKFTQEQKEKMLSFAEKVGWKIQKQEEGVVQQFCQEVGVKRRVLKVWMHNNKHNFAKKSLGANSENQV